MITQAIRQLLVITAMYLTDCLCYRFRCPGWDRSLDIEAGRVAMDGAMSAHTGVGVSARNITRSLPETKPSVGACDSNPSLRVIPGSVLTGIASNGSLRVKLF